MNLFDNVIIQGDLSIKSGNTTFVKLNGISTGNNYINNSGNFGIGTNVPIGKLDIRTTGTGINNLFLLYNNTSDVVHWFTDNGNINLNYSNRGKTVIGGTDILNPTAQLQVKVSTVSGANSILRLENGDGAVMVVQDNGTVSLISSASTGNIGLNITSSAAVDTYNYGVKASASAPQIGNGNTEAVGLWGSAILSGYTNKGIYGEALNGSASNYGVRGVVNSGGSVVPTYGAHAISGENSASIGSVNYGGSFYNSSTSNGSTSYGIWAVSNAGGLVTDSIGGYFAAIGGVNKYAILTPSNGGNIGFGILSPTSRLHIKGEGSTSSTFALKVENNTSLPLFSIKDNGSIIAGNQSTGNLNISNNSSSAGNYNTIYGINSFSTNISGEGNTAIGMYTLAQNTSGSFNLALGYSTLYSLTTGSQNVAIGSGSMRDSITGGNNVAVGVQSLYYTNGVHNVSIGNFSSKAINTGEYNTVIGSYGMEYATTSSLCVAIGSNTLAHLVAGGHRNTSVGADSGANVITGNYNTFLGWGAGTINSSSGITGSMAIGSNSNVLTNNTLAFGGIGNSAAIYNVYIGEGERGTNSTNVNLSPSYQEGLNVGGGNFTITGGQSTGSGNGGDIIFKTSNSGSTGSTLNTLSEVLRIKNNRTLQYTDGNQGAGKILTSDVNGVATWQTPSAGTASTLQATTTAGNTTTDDIEITDFTKGIILKSPNGTRFRITVDNTGSLNTTQL